MSGLGPQYCQLVENMYTQASSCIKVGNRLGQSFTTNVGTQAGGPPIPPPLQSLHSGLGVRIQDGL